MFALGRKLRYLPLVLALTSVVFGFENIQQRDARAQQAPQPPTTEPGWIFVGNQRTITFPDGGRVTLPDQSRVPEAQRIGWVRRTVSATLPPGVNPPPRGPRASAQLTTDSCDPYMMVCNLDHAVTARTESCSIFGGYCALIEDSSWVYYRVVGNTFRIDECYAMTNRTWNNPYQLPQLSYDKVKSFVVATLAGGYAPVTGTVQAQTWTYVAPCFTNNFSTGYNDVMYGSRWDVPAGDYETEEFHLLPPP